MDSGHKTDMTNADHCIVKPNGKFTRKGKDFQIVWKARGHKRYKKTLKPITSVVLLIVIFVESQ